MKKNLKLPVLLLCIALAFGGVLACDLGAAKQQPPPASEEATVAPQAAEATLTPVPTAAPPSFAEAIPSPEVEEPSPTPILVGLPDGSEFPLPGDAEVVPVVEGFYVGFVTSLSEPELFDFYTARLGQSGWELVAPTAAVVERPNQRWRNGEVELLIELQSPDEQGRSVAWVQVSSVASPPPAAAASPAPSLGGWTASNGGPDNARANLSARLSLPLALAWEWGDGENAPAAVAAERGRLFLLTEYGELLLLQADTGAEVARLPIWPEREIKGSTRGEVAITGDAVIVAAAEDYFKPGERYVSTRSRLAAFSFDGQPLWELAPVEENVGYPMVADQRLVMVAPLFTGGVEWLAAFDAASGAEHWRITQEARAPEVSDGKNLYVYDAAYSLATGELQWRESQGLISSMVYADGRLYAAKGPQALLVALDPGTGQILWQSDFTPEKQAPSVAAAHGQFYLIPESGTGEFGYRTGVLALDAATGQRRWYALGEENLSAESLAVAGNYVLAKGTDYDTWANLLFILDAANGAVLDRVELGDYGLAAVAGDMLYMQGPTLRAYGPGQAGVAAPTKPALPPPPPSATPVPTTTALPPTPAGGAVIPTGRYGQVWERWGGAGGPLGWGLAPAVEGFYAGQRFERGFMHWGRLDTLGEPNYEVQIIVYGEGGNTRAGDLWLPYEDYWKEGDEEYSCPEAKPPLGPKRGFGLLWCKYKEIRDSLGAPLEEEWGEQGGYQDFVGGRILWLPRDGGVYVLLNRGDWHFEPVE
jgi:outer membrane protein assembly factor BamB